MPQRPRLAYTASLARQGAAALVLSLCAAQASAAYNAAYCQSVANTLNIHWEAVSGPFAPCAGIEFTDATVADAAGGTVSMIGMSVSDETCVGMSMYTLSLTPDTLQLTGSDTYYDVPMTLTRGPGEQCFVGIWSQGDNVYEAHIWAEAFPLLPPAPTSVPGPAGALLALQVRWCCGAKPKLTKNYQIHSTMPR